MKSRVEKYIPKAVDLINKVNIADSDGNVDNVFNGYFSAFGAAIIMNGVKPTLAFYANTKSVGARAHILTAIYCLITDEPVSEATPSSLLQFYITEENNTRAARLQEKIIDAAVALKLAIRTYNLQKN